jgi:arsenite methyltransferase
VPSLRFLADMARLQRLVAQTHDMSVRRSAVVQALNLRPGERILEAGCGGGAYTYETARFVGPAGRVCAIDVSPDQIAAASERCRDVPWVECRVADVTALPFADGEFDAAFAVQVLEYVPELDDALREIGRVLRPGGRAVILSTNWSSLVWHSDHPQRMTRVLDAWTEHAYLSDLPAVVGPRLRRAGLEPHRQTPVPMLNTSYQEHAVSFWLARLIRAFVVGRNGITETEGDAWLHEFDDLEAREEYFFSATPVLTEALRASNQPAQRDEASPQGDVPTRDRRFT